MATKKAPPPPRRNVSRASNPPSRQAAPAAQAAVRPQQRTAPPPPSRAVVPRSPSTTLADLPDDVLDLLDENEGAGLSGDQADNLVPYMVVLQPLSPQCLRTNQAYMDGAEPGLIWLKNHEEPFQPEIYFQPCYFTRDWCNWRPRNAGGGYLGRYPVNTEPGKGDKPPSHLRATLFKDPERPNAIRWKLPDGTDLVETRYYAGYVHLPDRQPMAYTMALSSTGHTFAKDLMFKLNSRTTRNGGRAPIYANMVHIVTRARSNNAGEWHQYEVADINFIMDRDQILAGRALQETFESGEKQFDVPQDEEFVQGDGSAGGADSNRRM